MSGRSSVWSDLKDVRRRRVGQGECMEPTGPDRYGWGKGDVQEDLPEPSD